MNEVWQATVPAGVGMVVLDGVMWVMVAPAWFSLDSNLRHNRKVELEIATSIWTFSFSVAEVSVVKLETESERAMATSELKSRRAADTSAETEGLRRRVAEQEAEIAVLKRKLAQAKGSSSSSSSKGGLGAFGIWLFIAGLFASYGVLQLSKGINHLPKPGVKIGASHYAINEELLLDAAWTVSRTKPRDTLGNQLAAAFLKSDARDPATVEFLEASRRASETWLGRAIIHAKFRAFLVLKSETGLFGWSRTDASSFVRMSSMFVASPAQFRRLLEVGGGRVSSTDNNDKDKEAAAAAATTGPRLLDIGAGRGFVTQAVVRALGARSEDVTAMEMSWPLRVELANTFGFHAVSTFDDIRATTATTPSSAPSESSPPRFDVVALLNVLDRCDDPRDLLRSAIRRLKPGGRFLLATVIPFCGAVFGARGRKRAPKQPLVGQDGTDLCKRRASTFEAGVAAFVAALFEPEGLEVAAWTRVPYLSSGDTVKTHYSLDNAIFLLRKR